VTSLRDTSELLWPAVSETLASLDLGSEDAAAKKLAQRLAQNIDAMTDQVYAMRWLVPELLKVLDALGATPESRSRIRKIAKTGGDAASAEPSRLDQLRQSRAARRTP
jgi:hypothetical protein